MTKICLITCYNQPDYIRAKTLRAAFGAMDDVELIVIKNKHTGALRYPEVLWKTLVARVTKHPDIYFLTFRGYEMLPFVRLLTLGKPFIFDEFINFVEWVVYEHHKLKPGSVPAKIFQAVYRLLLMMPTLITTDSLSHAKYSAKLMKLPLAKYVPLIVSTDEQTFHTQPAGKKGEGKAFNVFYYGNMLPLHGIDTVIEAMQLLKDQEDIELTLIGGKERVQTSVAEAQRDGVHINYTKRVPFEALPSYMQAADICLGGPFGGTVQAQFVITGKAYQFLQMGRPVIIGENEESGIFTDKKDSLLVQQAYPQALADAIVWAKNHPSELEKIGTAGHELYQKKLSNKVLEKQLQLLLGNERIL